VHVNTADAIWAFELTQRATEIAGRLAAPAVRFAPGPLAGAGEPAIKPGGAAALPSPDQLAAAAEIATGIADQELRKSVQKAVGLGLARASQTTPSDTL